MAYTFEWKITGLKKQNSDNLSDVIIGTNWLVTATDEDGHTGAFNGATPFKLSEVDPNNFTPFSELTQTQVLGWIQNTVSGSAPTSYWGHIMDRINEQIQQKRYVVGEVTENNLPWSPTSGSVTPGYPPAPAV